MIITGSFSITPINWFFIGMATKSTWHTENYNNTPSCNTTYHYDGSSVYNMINYIVLLIDIVLTAAQVLCHMRHHLLSCVVLFVDFCCTWSVEVCSDD